MTASEAEPPSDSGLMAWARDNQDALADYLLELVRIETPSDVPETFEPFFERLGADLAEAGLQTERVPGEETGGRLEAWSPGAPDADQLQLVIGHADTVWPVGTLDENPPSINDGRLSGPGALDMKGGLAQFVFARRALSSLSLEPPLPVHAIVSSDEEVGSPESKPRIRDLAQRANRVFVLEPASGPEGTLKIARKTVGRFTVTIEGKAAHAGLEPEAGASATEELGTVIGRLHALSDPDAGVTVNVGTVEAGLRSNVVAPDARAEVDVRAPTEAAASAVEEKIRALEASTPGTTLTVAGGFGRPPMEQTPGNRLLWQRVRAVGRRLGLDLDGTRAGGASDGNDASQYAPTIDGIGAVGDGAHQEFEYVSLEALAERVALLAACLVDEPLPDTPRTELEDPQ